MSNQARLHATTVAFEGKGVLILGAAGSGKSGLALQLMALGCQLVADDQTELTRQGDNIWARAPEAIKGLIEARGIGILQALATEAPVVVAIDLDQVEAGRLPLFHELNLLGQMLPCLHKVDNVSWPAAILQYLKGGRREPK